MTGIKSMTISKQLIDSDHTIDLWRLTTNEFEGWEYGKVLIASDSPDKYKVSQLDATAPSLLTPVFSKASNIKKNSRSLYQ